MLIKNIQINNRPREKLVNKGVESLSNEELLAIILRCGTKNKSVLELAYDVLNKANSISNLSEIKYEELIKIPGIKQANASVLLACFELVKRSYVEVIEKQPILTSNDAFKLINPII
ncbi:MAG: UPF0758 domain-containing protein, partial [Anaeroplasmataceae bacterium]